MSDSTALTLALLRRELTSDPTIPLPAAVDTSNLLQAFRLSARHDLAHMVGAALKRDGLGGGSDVMQQFRRQRHLALYRYEYITFEIQRACAALEAEHIPHLLLKGAHLRKYYPAPEMRTSSDIDLLVKPCDLDRAITALTDRIGYTYVHRSSHDVLLLTPSGIHFELHYDLIEHERYRQVRRILASVWESAVPMDGSAYGYTMSLEMLFFYHIAHMVKHFTDSGCGIRFFMDLWVLMHCTPSYDNDKLEKMLSDCGMLTFCRAVCDLAEVWFAGAEHTDLTKKIEKFVVSGGVYGSVENRVRLKRAESNRTSYLFSRIFLPYDSMKYQYPILQKHAWLLPFYEVHRWFRLLSKPTADRIRSEVAFNQSLPAEVQSETRELLKQLGL